MDLLYVDPVNSHDLTNVKRNRESFAVRLRGCRVLLDKGTSMVAWLGGWRRGVEYDAIKRKNMIRSRKERLYYRVLNRVRRLIETRFSQLEESEICEGCHEEGVGY